MLKCFYPETSKLSPKQLNVPQHSHKCNCLRILQHQTPGMLNKSCNLKELIYSNCTVHFQGNLKGNWDWKTIHSCLSFVSSESKLGNRLNTYSETPTLRHPIPLLIHDHPIITATIFGPYTTFVVIYLSKLETFLKPDRSTEVVLTRPYRNSDKETREINE